MKSDGYAKAAMSLAALSGDDRHWLLSQLADGDRARLVAALQGISEIDARANTAPAPRRDESDDQRIVDDAAPETIIELLAHEPDWLVAILLTHAEWSWADEFMEACPPQRLQDITAAMKHEAAAVKASVRTTILRILAQKLRHQQPPTARPLSSFERILTRAERKLSDAWKRDTESA